LDVALREAWDNPDYEVVVRGLSVRAFREQFARHLAAVGLAAVVTPGIVMSACARAPIAPGGSPPTGPR